MGGPTASGYKGFETQGLKRTKKSDWPSELKGKTRKLFSPPGSHAH